MQLAIGFPDERPIACVGQNQGAATRPSGRRHRPRELGRRTPRPSGGDGQSRRPEWCGYWQPVCGPAGYDRGPVVSTAAACASGTRRHGIVRGHDVRYQRRHATGPGDDAGSRRRATEDRLGGAWSGRPASKPPAGRTEEQTPRPVGQPRPRGGMVLPTGPAGVARSRAAPSIRLSSAPAADINPLARPWQRRRLQLVRGRGQIRRLLASCEQPVSALQVQADTRRGPGGREPGFRLVRRCGGSPVSGLGRKGSWGGGRVDSGSRRRDSGSRPTAKPRRRPVRA